MKTRSVVTTTAVLAGATALGIAAGSATFALWKTDTSIKSSVTTGQFSLQVQDGNGGGTPSSWAAASYGTIGFNVNAATPAGNRPADPLAALDSGAPQAYPIKVDSSAWGRFGLAFDLKGLSTSYTGAGNADTALIAASKVVISTVSSSAACTPSYVPSSAATIYSGPLSDAATLPSNPVQGVQGNPAASASDTKYVCLQFSVPGSSTPYTNEVTVNGEGTGLSQSTVKATDTWTSGGGVGFTAAQRSFSLQLKVAPTLNRATP
ncbi:hypothetical protein DWB68_02090 [Galactobacter valiniphilus]|uniref:Ribosomally synthesized peptide with SipW-like signal peptide n=1 Tax=Galactobacter valiniphilus TaxID=2676122 RepID=A0A399JD03_9MICC|nr:hypothetical protein [Galactobacter valiniphilus]RII43418.1 hypothetical protein DWB68_02090 [Galactobacter valiniphilus]